MVFVTKRIFMITSNQVKAAFSTVALLGKVVYDLKEIPAGKFYAMVCDKLSLEQFNAAIGVLERSNMVTRDVHHMIRWIEKSA